MKKFNVVGPFVGIASGLVQITPDQAKPRMHCLKAVDAKAGVFQVTSPIQFKKGEAFGHDGELNRLQALDLANSDGTPVEVKPAGKAAGKSKGDGNN